MGCPKKYNSELSAKLDAGKMLVKSKGKRDLVVVHCNKCQGWHLKEEK